MEDQEEKDIKKGMRSIWMIWLGILSSLYIYVKIGHFEQPGMPYLSEANLPLDLIKYIFYGLSIIIFVVTFYIRKDMLSAKSGKTDEKIIERAAKMNKPAAVMKYTGAVVVSIALAELIGIFGVVFFFISGDLETLYSLIGVSAVTMIYFCPKKKELIAVSNNFEKTVQT